MRKLSYLLIGAAAAVLAACSGGSDNTLGGGNGGAAPGGTTPEAEVATLTLLTSSPQIPSDGTGDATISALVRDANNNVMENVAVVFTADSGSLAVAQPGTTDANGVLTATLSTAGDPTNRTITVTGIAGDVESSVTVDVTGTELQVNGPASLPQGTDGAYNVVLTDAGGAGIPDTQVTISSSLGNAVSASPVTTDALGRASFTLTANTGGDETITAEALGITATYAVAISDDAFAFSAPESAAEILLGATATATVNWQRDGGPVVGEPVNFSTTRGTVNGAAGATVVTDAQGNASVTIASTNAGPAVVTATNDDGTSVQVNVEFVATTPATLELQASPFTVPASGESAITAIVRDPNGNLVKNQTVNFVLTDVSGGSLTIPSAITDSQGRAQTTYTASSATSAVDGVRIDATVQGTTITDSVFLTVAQREMFITLGTGNEISEPNTAQYQKEWIVQVTDAQGNGVAGVDVTLGVLSERYIEGVRVKVPGAGWDTDQRAFCADEDLNRNGLLDTGEDQNGNGRLEAGNIATVVAQGSGGGAVTTDENGFALIDLFWPQEYAYYLEVTLEARTSVQGSESSKSTTFQLDGLADDFNDENVAPPGVNSPFGTDGNCGTPPPPDGT